MQELVLTMLDTSGIQAYIFNSNRLQENIGASELVYRATTLWAFQALNDAKLTPHNVEVSGTKWRLNDGNMEDPASPLKAEVIYAGGGNTLILFKNITDAKVFTKQITRKVIEDAPGLNLVASHLNFDFDSDQLADTRSKLVAQLAAHKQSRLPSVPMLGLGVSAVCQSTGLPAVGTNKNLRPSSEEEIRLISRETRAKLKARNDGNKRLRDELGKNAGSYDFPYDIDKLGRDKGDESYVAVVHADGNRMGEHLNEAIKDSKNNRECIRLLREFSININEASLRALLHVVGSAKEVADQELVPVIENYLPIRPLVFGGDDATFLCNGKLGISLAVKYLEEFESETEKIGMQEFFASAGVSIVKMHYPFARAYALSEQLLSNAKRFVRSQKIGTDCSAFDWHFATGGLSGSIGIIREREYQNGDLLMRPLLLRRNDSANGRHWKNGIEEVIRIFREEKPWKDSHNKVVGLRDVLRDNTGEQVKAYLRDYELGKLPEHVNEEAQTTGWSGDRCTYFDAVELLDHHISIKGKMEVQA
jgi:hypothetical protein